MFLTFTPYEWENYWECRKLEVFVHFECCWKCFSCFVVFAAAVVINCVLRAVLKTISGI